MASETVAVSHGLKPFVKWPGGKRWLTARYPSLFNLTEGARYFEPFVGGAAVFAHLRPKKALLSDSVEELVSTYNAVRENPSRVQELLARHGERHSRHYYYMVRDSVPTDEAHVAARFLYLNRTCFNGMYRVNRMGKFNVPIGTRTNVLFPDDDFHAWSELLRSASVLVADYSTVLPGVQRGDFVFADPPYTVRHNMNGFRKYNESLFSWTDQIRLASLLVAAATRGANVVVTNANHPEVSSLYPASFKRRAIRRRSTIAASRDKRGVFEELILWTEGAIDESVF